MGKSQKAKGQKFHELLQTLNLKPKLLSLSGRCEQLAVGKSKRQKARNPVET